MVFKNSWLMKGEFICYTTNKDSFDDIVAIENSEELVTFRKRNESLKQYCIKLHSGSIVDIVCEQLILYSYR